jgi:transposase
VKNRAGKIVVNELKFTGSDDPEDQQKFEGRNWAGHELSTMIAYKAKLHGIEAYIQKAE